MIAFYTRFKTNEENREKFAALLAQASSALSEINGCKLYDVVLDKEDPTITSVIEFWQDESAHQASLLLPEAKELIAKAVPLIIAKPQQARLGPVVSHWL